MVAMDPQPAAYAPPVVGYAAPSNYVVHPHGVQYASAPVMREGYRNPYVYVQEVKPQHEPHCRYVSPERRRKNSIANALAALFIVCWCCTWPCHGPCCCGL